MRGLAYGVAVAVALGAGPAVAWEDGWLDQNVPEGMAPQSYESDDGVFALRGSIGLIGLQAKEYVYAATGSKGVLSYLLWEGVAPLASTDLRLRLPGDFTIKAELRGALYGSHKMEDYDWLSPYAGTTFDSWSHRSESPNTQLDWYLDAALSLGHDFYVDDTMRVNFNVGGKYTDIRWTAIGGTAVYSQAGFRDTEMTFANTPVITYRQQIPAVFSGIDVESKEGDRTGNSAAQGGYALFALATDDHWLRSLRFSDALYATPMYTAKLSAAYNLNRNAAIFGEFGVEQMLLARGDTTQTGASSGYFADAAGAEFANVSFSTGLRASF